jgi:hypothetical protein
MEVMPQVRDGGCIATTATAAPISSTRDRIGGSAPRTNSTTSGSSTGSATPPAAGAAL